MRAAGPRVAESGERDGQAFVVWACCLVLVAATALGLELFGSARAKAAIHPVSAEPSAPLEAPSQVVAHAR